MRENKSTKWTLALPIVSEKSVSDKNKKSKFILTVLLFCLFFLNLYYAL
jgi:hypothetical protein